MRAHIQFKAEKRRVLVPVGEPCPFGCRYCYTRGGEVGPGRVDEDEILSRFHCFASTYGDTFDTIQFGYDGDPFARPERGLRMLKRLASLDKNVNFSTKAALNSSNLNTLSAIYDGMMNRGVTLSALVSLSCWNSACSVEPHTPSPQQRIQTVKELKQRGIPVFIAVRPVLPHIDDEEYEQIFREGIRAGCDGFILGPLYVDEQRRFSRFIPAGRLDTVPSQRGPVTWSAHTPTWTRYEEGSRGEFFSQRIETYGGRVFHSSANAMDGIARKMVML